MPWLGWVGNVLKRLTKLFAKVDDIEPELASAYINRSNHLLLLDQHSLEQFDGSILSLYLGPKPVALLDQKAVLLDVHFPNCVFLLLHLADVELLQRLLNALDLGLIFLL